MAKDKSIPSNIVLAKEKFKYDTIQDMVNDIALKVGMVVDINGYYKPDDGATHKRVIADSDDGSGVQLRSGLWANIYDEIIKSSFLGIKEGQECTDILNKIIARETTKELILDVNIKVTAKNSMPDDKRGGLSAIIIPINKKIKIFGNGNTIELNKNNLYSYGIIEPRLNSKLVLENVIIKGDASVHDYTGQQYETHEWCSGIISGEFNPSFLYLKNCKIYDCVGDGITLNCYDYVIDNCKIINNGRNNISVISSKFGIIRNTILNEAGKPSSNVGFSPKAGIDLEGEKTKIDEINTIIDNCIATNCGFAGFQASPRRVSKFNIEFNNCISDNNTNQNYISSIVNEFKGTGVVIFNNCISKNGDVGFCFNGLGENSKTFFNNCISINNKRVCYSLIKSDREHRIVNVFGNFKIIGNATPMSISGGTNIPNVQNVYMDSINLNFDYLTGLNRYNIYGVFYAIKMKKNNEEYKFENIVCNVTDKNGVGTIIMDITSDDRLRYNLEQCICNNKYNYIIVSGNNSLKGMRYDIAKKFTVLNNKIYRISNLSNQNITLVFETSDIIKIEPKQFLEILILNNGTELSYKILNKTVENVSQLNSLHMGEKMKQEGVYEDFINYMDEKTVYDKQQRKLEQDKQLAYEQALKENPELTYEEFMSVQPMTLNLVEEPQPSQALKEFMEKYL